MVNNSADIGTRQSEARNHAALVVGRRRGRWGWLQDRHHSRSGCSLRGEPRGSAHAQFCPWIGSQGISCRARGIEGASPKTKSIAFSRLIAINVIFAGFLALSGCANAPVYLAKMTPQQLQNVPMHNLCFAYAFNQQSSILDELRRRREFSEADLALIQAHDLEVGMHRSAAECTLALNPEAVITIGQEPGTTKLVYHYVRTSLFVRDDVVTGIQHF